MDYPQRGELLNGIINGFHVIDSSQITQQVEMDNYSSVTSKQNINKVADQIKFELAHGHYKICDNKPQIISALGAIPKKGSDKMRIIHDCSRPVGHAVNDFAITNSFSYQTLQDAIDLITPGCYLAKLDLCHAYRVVRLHPSNYSATGLKFTFPGDSYCTYMYDSRLPFGAKRSPEIFNSLTQAVRVMMKNKGIPGLVAYLDDFLIVTPSFDQTRDALLVLVKLLRKLGFWINYNKIEGPSQRLTFLGIILDTNTMKLELPYSKLKDLYHELTTLLQKSKVSKRTLQRIAGKLNWATQCVYGGRFYLRRIFDMIVSLN